MSDIDECIKRAKAYGRSKESKNMFDVGMPWVIDRGRPSERRMLSERNQRKVSASPVYNSYCVPICIDCKHIKDAAYQREKGKGKLNKKELMHAGYDSDTEEQYLKGMRATTEVRWFSDVWRSRRYE